MDTTGLKSVQPKVVVSTQEANKATPAPKAELIGEPAAVSDLRPEISSAAEAEKEALNFVSKLSKSGGKALEAFKTIDLARLEKLLED